LRLARRRAFERTPELIEKYRFRAGGEATMPQFDRRTGVKHLRVRGMKAVRFGAFLKAAGSNIFRTAAFKRRQNGGKSPTQGPFPILHTLFQLLKERFTSMSASNLDKILRLGLGFQY
jgi:hypothetical protein